MRLQWTYVEPPEGWFIFGTHVDTPGPLEFSEELDEGGLPRWERPVASGDESVSPCDHQDAQ
jgi:hypothetical protein